MSWKYLVILESPGKVKKVQSYLGNDYKVIASYGHCIDLPKKKLSVNIKKDFEPTYEVYAEKKDVITNIVSLAKNAQLVYLMTDEDREGEAISYHISKQLPKNVKYKRAKTNSITQTAVQNAINSACDIDYDLVDSYETRRILDRLVGYKCSYITTSATGGKSAGRVQSAALRVLAEREKEIQSFKPEEYWEIAADMITPNRDVISAKLVKPDKFDIKNKESADLILNKITNQKFVVSKYETKEVSVSPKSPFTTSTLQQTAASMLNWDQDKTMRVAQKLYEDGFITYMRTDSVYITQPFIDSIRTYIKNNYKSEYLPQNACIYKNKVTSQAAHEAIRPVDISVQSITADAESRKLYDLIWRRTVASQASNAKTSQVSIRFAYDQYEFGASGSTSIFDGWKLIWNFSSAEDKILPVLKQNTICEIKNIVLEQKFTQPPSRYTKSSITKMYEDTGIGRPSTYANITKTLKDRKYIESVGNSYKATDLGIKVCDFLIKSNFCFIDLSFTSTMEDKLDKIGEKELKKLEVLQEFWLRLKADIDNAQTVKNTASETEFECKLCKNKLLKKHSKFGPFFACSNKECKYIANLSETGTPVDKVVKEKKYSEFSCHLCSSKMVHRAGKFGEFLGCDSYPKCRGMRKSDGTVVEAKPKSFKYKKKTKNQTDETL